MTVSMNWRSGSISSLDVWAICVASAPPVSPLRPWRTGSARAPGSVTNRLPSLTNCPHRSHTPLLQVRSTGLLPLPSVSTRGRRAPSRPRRMHRRAIYLCQVIDIAMPLSGGHTRSARFQKSRKCACDPLRCPLAVRQVQKAPPSPAARSARPDHLGDHRFELPDLAFNLRDRLGRFCRLVSRCPAPSFHPRPAPANEPERVIAHTTASEAAYEPRPSVLNPHQRDTADDT
jgi:hypothetical protein